MKTEPCFLLYVRRSHIGLNFQFELNDVENDKHCFVYPTAFFSQTENPEIIKNTVKLSFWMLGELLSLRRRRKLRTHCR